MKKPELQMKTVNELRLDNNKYIIFLLYAYGFTQRAIARLLDVSQAPVYKRINDVRLMLETASVGDELEEEDESDGYGYI